MSGQDETIRIPVETEDGEVELEIQTKFEVCPRCQGAGSHVNPAIDGHGITAEEWNGPDWDDDSRAMYMSGGYDVACHRCGGKRVIAVADWEKLTDAERKFYEDYLREIRELEAEEAAERRFGC